MAIKRMKQKKRCYIVFSCCLESEQVFTDLVAAVDDREALVLVSRARPYAALDDAIPLVEYADYLAELCKKTVAEVEADWRKTAKDPG